MKKVLIFCLFFLSITWVILTQVPLPLNNLSSLSASANLIDLVENLLVYYPSPYEVWAIDQADSRDGTSLGGNLFVLSGNDYDFVTGTAKKYQFNLAANAVNNGFVAGSKPHWITFNKGATYAIVGHASSGHVYAINTAKRQVADVVIPGKNSHAISISPDNQFVFVADTPGGQIHKIYTNYQASKGKIFGQVQTLKFDETVLQALGTDTAQPVVAQVDNSGQWVYVTFAKGGTAIVNARTLTVAHVYSSTEVTFNGLIAYQTGQNFVTNAGNADPQITDFIYIYDNKSLLTNPSQRPAIIKVPQSGNDVHGAVLLNGKYFWQVNRASNSITIHKLNPNPVDPNVEGSSKARAVNLIDLVGEVLGPDPTPDLIGVSPSQQVAFLSQRGPFPISGNDPQFFNSVGIYPGIAVVRVKDNGKNAIPAYLYRFDNFINGKNIADFHALAVRK
ncbi:DNA-binding beta-propeller fold protein YncE [Nostoc flagelliforme CCNUN1]|uniref:DNA-binding beta-propeller fold protein YncE n=1 Tax=Nostoc flagelliforme CCNUN1 TaxID=2038116 RepID=A0A2K8SUR4_9NOSO|nr:beta-propeller fold lactonase family protein [Nostoc flagelliforme]AUB39191.1 DNA-binding beta-propeller fold protein YncE [Nostoc flagelliforme CCNUN1]